MANKKGRSLSDNDMSNVSGGSYKFIDDLIILLDDDGEPLGDGFVFKNDESGRKTAESVVDFINSHDFTDKNGKKITISKTAIFN